MKKRILVSAIVLALVAVLVMPMAALAGTTTDVGGTLDVPTITGIDPATGVKGNTYIGVVITGTYLTAATAVTFSGGDITTNTVAVVDATHITCNVVIATGAALGARDVIVTNTPGGTDTLTGGFTVVAATFTINAPGPISLGIMVRDLAATGNGSGTVETTAQNWTVTAKDASTGTNKGHMLSGSTPLASALGISKTASGYVDADVGITYTQAGGTTLKLYVSQTAVTADTAGTYSITITFTGSAQ